MLTFTVLDSRRAGTKVLNRIVVSVTGMQSATAGVLISP